MVLAPNTLVDQITTEEYKEQVKAYQYAASRQSEIERLAVDKENRSLYRKLCCQPGQWRKNPGLGGRLRVMGYGTGRLWRFPPMMSGTLPLPVSITPIRIVITPDEGLSEPDRGLYRSRERKDG